MTVKVDEKKCIGCGLCESICPNVFTLKDGKSKVKDKEGDKRFNCAKEAAESCPVSAISIS